MFDHIIYNQTGFGVNVRSPEKGRYSCSEKDRFREQGFEVPWTRLPEEGIHLSN